MTSEPPPKQQPQPQPQPPLSLNVSLIGNKKTNTHVFLHEKQAQNGRQHGPQQPTTQIPITTALKRSGPLTGSPATPQMLLSAAACRAAALVVQTTSPTPQPPQPPSRSPVEPPSVAMAFTLVTPPSSEHSEKNVAHGTTTTFRQPTTTTTTTAAPTQGKQPLKTTFTSSDARWVLSSFPPTHTRTMRRESDWWTDHTHMHTVTRSVASATGNTPRRCGNLHEKSMRLSRGSHKRR